MSTALGQGGQQLQWEREVWALLRNVFYFPKLSRSGCGYRRARLSLR